MDHFMKKITIKNEQSSVQQSVFQTIADQLSYVEQNMRTILFTGSDAAINLRCIPLDIAGSLAKGGKRILVIDVNISDEGAQAYEKPEYGLAHYLSGKCSVDQIIYETSLPGVDLIPSGSTVPNPHLLFETGELEALVKDCAQKYDWLLINGMQTKGKDNCIVPIASMCNGSVLVAWTRHSHKAELRRAKALLERTGCPVIGCTVLIEKKTKAFE